MQKKNAGAEATLLKQEAQIARERIAQKNRLTDLNTKETTLVEFRSLFDNACKAEKGCNHPSRCFVPHTLA